MLAALAIAVVAYVAIVIAANRSLRSRPSLVTPQPMAELPSSLPRQITLTTWNLGYAGLGAKSETKGDGGKSLLPPSAQIVQKNLDGIVATLGQLDQDMLMLQEVSKRSLLSFWRPMLSTLVAALPHRQIAFRPDVVTWGLPVPLAIDHFTMVALKANPRNVEIVPLPLEPGHVLGLIKRTYALQVVRLPIDGMSSDWVLVNLHLSAFDEGATTRHDQLAAVLAFAQAEYAKGNHVILGGDWNMVLSDPKLPTTTENEFLFWIFDFPYDQLPAGWQMVAPQGATVRTLQKPYVEGENFRTTIDGFMVSPNVTPSTATVHDTKFAFSDHIPVTASFTAN
jgi:endonuclease/exonuclease/phosphatase family metal-dependent hydrolase